MLKSQPDCFAAVPAAVLNIAHRLSKAGFSAYLVGGWIRDFMLGATSGDFDLATDASPGEVLERFPRAVPIGRNYGTVMIPTPVGPVDVTTFRGGSLESDLRLRDFTVNAVAVRLADGVWIDPTGGLDDLANDRLRCPGEPAERFSEDPLRVLRAARLVATTPLRLDPSLRGAMSSLAPRLAEISRERIYRELIRLLSGDSAWLGIRILREVGAESVLLAPVERFLEDAALPRLRDLRSPELRLSAWVLGAHTDALTSRLRLPRRVADRLRRIERGKVILRSEISESDVWLRRQLAKHGEDTLRDLIDLAKVWEPESELTGLGEALHDLRAQGPPLQASDLALTGRDVMECLGCPPGPRVGAALRFLLDQVVTDPTRNQPHVLRALLEGFRDGESERRPASSPGPAASRSRPRSTDPGGDGSGSSRPGDDGSGGSRAGDD